MDVVITMDDPLTFRIDGKEEVWHGYVCRRMPDVQRIVCTKNTSMEEEVGIYTTGQLLEGLMNEQIYRNVADHRRNVEAR